MSKNPNLKACMLWSECEWAYLISLYHFSPVNCNTSCFECLPRFAFRGRVHLGRPTDRVGCEHANMATRHLGDATIAQPAEFSLVSYGPATSAQDEKDDAWLCDANWHRRHDDCRRGEDSMDSHSSLSCDIPKLAASQTLFSRIPCAPQEPRAL
jgi:hypothetical protein